MICKIQSCKLWPLRHPLCCPARHDLQDTVMHIVDTAPVTSEGQLPASSDEIAYAAGLTCVVLPLPVSPTTMITWFSRITCTRPSGRIRRQGMEAWSHGDRASGWQDDVQKTTRRVERCDVPAILYV